MWQEPRRAAVVLSRRSWRGRVTVSAKRVEHVSSGRGSHVFRSWVLVQQCV